MPLVGASQIIIVAMISMHFFSAPLLASITVDPVNVFYRSFVDLLKKGKTLELEQLIKSHREVATRCLEVIQDKIGSAGNQQKAEAYVLLGQELQELLALAKGSTDCAMAQKILDRATKSSIPEEEEKLFLRAVRLCPSNREIYLGLGDVSKRMGHFDLAVTSYGNALSLDQDNDEAMLGLGETLYSAGLYRRSLRYFERVLSAKPQNARVRKYFDLTGSQIAMDNREFLPASRLVDRLWGEMQGNLMCMCPQFARLNARVRLRHVTFPTESTRLSSRARRQLDELAKALKTEALDRGQYLIEGHADSIGQADFNERLSIARANVVKNYLVTTGGVDSAILFVAGMGESRPWTTNNTSSGRRANRRIEILSIDQKTLAEPLR